MADIIKGDWSYSTIKDGNAFPPNFIKLLWSYLKTDEMERTSIRPLSEEQLELLVNAAYGASLFSDEGRQVRFQIVFNWAPQKTTFSFSPPRDYKIKELVKLAPTIDIGPRWIVVRPKNQEDPKDNNLVISGIHDPKLTPQKEKMYRWDGLVAYELDNFAMRIWVFAPGHIRIETGGGAFIELQGCNIRFPFSISHIKLVSDWRIEASSKIGFPPKDHLSHIFAIALIRRTWNHIVSQVVNARHGGTFLIIPDDLDISALLNVKYPINSPILRDSISSRAAIEPDLSKHKYGVEDISFQKIDAAPFVERDLEHATTLVSSLAAVDGAVIIRRDLTIEGFGAEIVRSEKDNDIVVKYGRHPHGTPPDKSLSDFGMRHRSAYRFCHENSDTIAIVISQDSNIHVFSNIKGEVRAFVGATAEEWVGCFFHTEEEKTL